MSKVTKEKEKEVSIKQIEMSNRQEKIKKLYFVQKMTLAQVAAALKTSMKTIERDTKEIRKAFVKEIKKETAEKLIMQALNQNEEIIKRAWYRYYGEDVKDRDKLSALKLIHDVETKNIDIYQQLGLIEKAAETIGLTGEVTVKWKD